MRFKNRHLLLMFGVLFLIVGSLLMSITITRIYWWFPPIGFYTYTTHPFMASGMAVATLGGTFVGLYVLFKVWAILKARKDERLKREAQVWRAQAEAAAILAASEAKQRTDDQVEEFEDEQFQEPALSPEPDWQPPSLSEAAEPQQ